MLTSKQIEDCKIPTSEIEQDINITQKEVDDYNDELSILMRNTSTNKLRIYMIEGHIIDHKKFIDELNQILEYRKNNN